MSGLFCSVLLCSVLYVRGAVAGTYIHTYIGRLVGMYVGIGKVSTSLHILHMYSMQVINDSAVVWGEVRWSEVESQVCRV